MTMRTILLSGIAAVAIAGGALAQSDAVPPQAANPGQTPATAPSAGIPGVPKHHRAYRGQSGPQYSTPAEKAATEKLNEEQLAQAKAAADAQTAQNNQPMAPATTPDQPTPTPSATTPDQPASPPPASSPDQPQPTPPVAAPDTPVTTQNSPQ